MTDDKLETQIADKIKELNAQYPSHRFYARKRDYNTVYKRERYKTDPAFREREKAISRAYRERKKKERQEATAWGADKEAS